MAEAPTQPAPAPTPEPPAPAPERAAPPERPTPDAPAPTPEPEAPAPSTEGQPAPTAEGPDWRALLDQVDPKELLSHPRVGGIVGSRLEAERRRAAQEAEQAVAARAQDERLRALREEDPAAYVQEVKAQEQERARAGQVLSGIHARIATWAATLPPEVQQKVSGKTYPGSYEDGVLAYTREVADLLTEHRVAEAVEKARAKWEKDVRPALRKEILAELNGEEPSPDTTRGAAPTNGFRVPATMAEINRLPTPVYKQHMKEIEAAVLSGRVK